MLMQNDTVLEVERLSKLYSRAQSVTRRRMAATFGHMLLGWPSKPPLHLQESEFWSLKDVSFSLRRGEALGVIGLNGAGKTTLLRLLAGQLLPDEGEIRILGQTAAMIDLTAGFQITANGARNIFLRGAMLGRTREEMAAVYDEIVDFAELGDAIDAPVSTYSSGMLMRLAFSIMVAMKSDVLFIDEILSVGDFCFRQKCLARIRELREQAAFVLVSHNMTDISRFCDRVMVLDKAKSIFIGEPQKGMELYNSLGSGNQKDVSKRGKRIIQDSFFKTDLINDVKHYWCDSEEQSVDEVTAGASLFFRCKFKMLYEARQLIVGVTLYDMGDQLITGISTDIDGHIINVGKNETCELTMSFEQVCLNPGTYQSAVGIVDGVEFLYMEENAKLNVLSSGKPFWGGVTLPHKWELKLNSESRQFFLS